MDDNRKNNNSGFYGFLKQFGDIYALLLGGTGLFNIILSHQTFDGSILWFNFWLGTLLIIAAIISFNIYYLSKDKQ